MRISLILVVLLAAVALASAGKKGRKGKGMSAFKLMKWFHKKCGDDTNVTWTPCTEGKMKKILSAPNSQDPRCNKEEEIDCIVEKTAGRGGCSKVVRVNYTPCGAGEEMYTMNVTMSGCKRDKSISKQLPCSGKPKWKKGAKKPWKKNGKNKDKKAEKKAKKQMMKEFIAKKKELKDKGCFYQKVECGESEMFALRPLDETMTKDASLCEPTLKGPCKKRKGGKMKNKKMKMKKRRGGCVYRRGTWSECDPVTNVKIMRKPLKRGDATECNATIVVEKPCKRPPKKNQGVCKYRRTQWNECDSLTNIKTMVMTLKRGDSTTCPPTQTRERTCKRKHKALKSSCKYKKRGKWSQCDLTTNTVSRVTILKKGDPKMCPPTKTMTKPCKKKRKGKRKRDCKYDKSQWGPCDAATNTVTRMLTLKAGDPTVCNATKTDIRKCKAKHLRPHVCKYRRTTWGECDPATKMKTMVKTLKRGDPAHCQPTTTIEKKCKRKVKKGCSYRYTAWSECDITTDRRTRKQILVSGPATCPKEKTFLQRCKKPCRFTNGEWSECDPETDQITRTDTLVPGSAEFCPPTRVLTKKCTKGKRCHYDYGNWSQCDDDQDNPKRTRIQKLISGGSSCQPEKTTTKPCKKPSGEDRCFFGPWQEFEPCQNGVQKKRREVLQGGLECERKSVKMKAC